MAQLKHGSSNKHDMFEKHKASGSQGQGQGHNSNIVKWPSSHISKCLPVKPYIPYKTGVSNAWQN